MLFNGATIDGKMKTKRVKVSDLKSNPDNPRSISDEKMQKLEKSIADFPEMLKARPIVVNQDLVVLGGNMRLRALLESGRKTVEVVQVDWSEEKQREFIVKDNLPYGEWDFDQLQEWDAEELDEWGLEVPEEDQDEDTGEPYTKKVEAPIYEITGEKPEVDELYDRERTDALLAQIKGADVPDEVKRFLKIAAERHTVFNYAKIAEYYAHAPAEVQELFEESALVIIDYEKAIERGFVAITQQMEDQYAEENKSEG